MRRALYIYNYLSIHNKKKNKFENIADYLRLGGIEADEFLFNENDLDSEKNILSRINENKYDLIISHGGDGTLNNVVNVKLKNNFKMPLGVIPGGTCNDFAGGLGLDNDIFKSLDIIIKGKTKFVDVGLINKETYFVGTCSGGSFVSVSYDTVRGAKKLFGKAAYYFKAVKKAFYFEKFLINVKISDQVIFKDNVIIFIVMNGHQAAGFKNIKKDAVMDDGEMNITFIKECSIFNLPQLLIKSFLRTLEKDKRVVSFKFSECDIEISDNVNVEIDGEKCKNTNMNIKIMPSLLNVFVK